MLIRVNTLKDEILFPSSRHCSMSSQLLTQLEMSYLFTPEFVDIVRQFQKHTGLYRHVHAFCSLCIVSRDSGNSTVFPRSLNELLNIACSGPAI